METVRMDEGLRRRRGWWKRVVRLISLAHSSTARLQGQKSRHKRSSSSSSTTSSLTSINIKHSTKQISTTSAYQHPRETSEAKERDEEMEKGNPSTTTAAAADASDEVVMKGTSNFEIPGKDLLSWLFDGNAYNHDSIIYQDALLPKRTITINQAKALVKELIAGLKAKGVKVGDAVCIHSFNDIHYPLLFLAIIGTGAIWVGTNPGSTRYELSHHLKLSQTKWVIAQPKLLPTVQAAMKEVGIKEDNLIVFDTPGQELPSGSNLYSYQQLFGCGSEDWVCFDNEETSKKTIMAFFSSSGTTGMPKAISLSHYAWVAGSVLLPEVLERPYEVVRLMCLPTFHGFAAPLTIAVPIRTGQRTVIMPRFDLATFGDIVQKYGVTDTAVVPPCLQAFIKTASYQNGQLKSIKRIWCGGAPLNVKLQVEALRVFAADAEVVNIWGMTEIGITVGLKYDEHDRTGAASKLLGNTEAKIINEAGTNVTMLEKEGELFIRSPQVASGYFANPEATAETFLENGWVRTGDIASFKDGKLYIVDRKKEMIKVRGWQVAPAELEAVLVSHPAIKDAAVIGVKMSQGDENDEHEAPRAFVVRQEGSDGCSLTAQQVKDYILSKLSKYKALDGGVFFVDAIPKSPSGKILKKIIRQPGWLREHQLTMTTTEGERGQATAA